MAPRLAAEDTVDPAVHFLLKLQAEGWAVESINCDFGHGKTSRRGRRIPVKATVVVKLKPAHS